jgi:hypothetical protein
MTRNARAARSDALARGRHHRHQRQALQRGRQRPGATCSPPRASCRTCPRWASPLPWSSCAAPMRRGAHHRLRHAGRLWQSRGHARAAGRRCSCSRPEGRIGQGRKRPPVQLPACGAPVQVDLATTKRLTCGSCHSLIDLDGGVGGRTAPPSRTSRCSPLIRWAPRASCRAKTGRWWASSTAWATEPGDDEHFGWSEYLLYNQKRGFSLPGGRRRRLEPGAPTTGAPNCRQRAKRHLPGHHLQD